MAKRRKRQTPPIAAASKNAPPKPASDLWRWAAPVLLVGIAVLAYCNSFSGPFLFDDAMNIRDNFAIRRLWPLSEMMWGPLGTGVAGRPVVQTSFAINYAVHGLSVGGYHIANLVLHTLTGLLLYGVIRRTLQTPRLAFRFANYAMPLAFLVAAVWLPHPLLTDSVTYIAGRTEILAAMFLLMTLYAFIRAAQWPRLTLAWKTVAVVAFAFGTGCKEIMVAGPLLVLIYDRLFLADSFRQIARERKYFYVALFACLGLIYLNLKMAGFHRTSLATQDELSSWQYLKIQAQVIMRYLRLSVWPTDLTIDYAGFPTDQTLLDVLPHALFILAMLAATVIGLARRRPAAYCGAWFFLILAPTSSILPLPTELATERRMYLPLMALVALAVIGGYALLERLTREKPSRNRATALAGGGLALVLVGLETNQTVTRNAEYKNPPEMWVDVAARWPNNSRAYTNLGIEALNANDPAAAKLLFLKAISVNPRGYVAMNNVATIYRLEGDRTAAAAALDDAIKIKPDYGPAYLSLGLVHRDDGDLDAAERYLREAIRLQSARTDRIPVLADVLILRGNPAEAERICREALRVDPRGARAPHPTCKLN
jgi:Tfp pilus assembly protein PilF